MSAARVLVVDDDDDIRGLVRTLLERAGAVVYDAPDGREGLREFHARRPDLVILDVAMPAMDGWQVLDRIRDMSDVPVIMLTAADDEMDHVRGIELGAESRVAGVGPCEGRRVDPLPDMLADPRVASGTFPEAGE